MLSRSNEYNQKIHENRKFLAKSIITFSDATELILYSYDRIRFVKINDGVSEDGQFTVGGAIINKLSLRLDNIDGGLSQYDFIGAKITQYIGLQLSETVEYLKKGVYTVDDATTTGGVISVTALDNMSMFDKIYTPGSYPASLLAILNDVCTQCGVTLITQRFTNSDLVISSAPEQVNCREIVSYIAQIAGCFARMNVDGYLEIKWYDMNLFTSVGASLDGGKFDVTKQSTYQTGDVVDGGNFTDYSGSNYDGGSFTDLNNIAHICKMRSQDIATDDITITGVQVIALCDDPTTNFFGQTGYVIEISDNPFIQTNEMAASLATILGTKMIGFTFRPYTVSALSNPAIEAGDVTYITDNKGNTYKSFISNITYIANGFETFTADAETKLENSAVKFDATSRILQQAKNKVDKKLSAYDIMMQNLTNLICNSFGAYKSEEVLEDGSTIFYMHDKATRAESTKIWKMTADGMIVSNDGGNTWNSGWDVNGNAVMNLLSAIGINAEWINAGQVSGDRLDFIGGKIGNLTIDLNGLVHNDPNTPFSNWTIDTGDVKLEFTALGFKVTSEIDFAGQADLRTTELTMDYNGVSLAAYGSYDSEGNPQSNARYSITYNNEVPEIRMYTAQNGQETQKIYVNDMDLVGSMNNTSDLMGRVAYIEAIMNINQT